MLFDFPFPTRYLQLWVPHVDENRRYWPLLELVRVRSNHPTIPAPVSPSHFLPDFPWSSSYSPPTLLQLESYSSSILGARTGISYTNIYIAYSLAFIQLLPWTYLWSEIVRGICKIIIWLRIDIWWRYLKIIVCKLKGKGNHCHRMKY